MTEAGGAVGRRAWARGGWRAVRSHGLDLVLIVTAAALLWRCCRCGMWVGAVAFGLLLAAALGLALGRILRRGRMGRWAARGRTLLAFLLLFPLLLAAALYESVFYRRFASDLPPAADVYDGLVEERHGFLSHQNKELAAFLYRQGEGEKKGLVVLVHGIGTDHKGYGEIIRFFAAADYLVFSYDATGCGESAGRSVRGLPQGVSDLDAALDYIQTQPALATLPLYLFGHSWGGYAASAVLRLHPEVRAVAALAGFDSPLLVLEAQGHRLIGGFIEPLLPYLSLYERLKFGPFADLSAMEGFAATQARVLIVASEDDETVPVDCGYARYRERYGENPRFTFLCYTDRGHTGLFTDACGALCLEVFAGEPQ